MITLHQFRPAFGLPNGSPFCMKVETWLRMAGLEYQTRACDDPRKNPKGKAPVITDDDGTVIADSEFIITHLNRKHAPGLDDHLTEQDLAHAHAFRRMLEEGRMTHPAIGRMIMRGSVSSARTNSCRQTGGSRPTSPSFRVQFASR